MGRKERDRATARNAGVVEIVKPCEGHGDREYGLTFFSVHPLGTFGVAACCEGAARAYAGSLLTGEEFLWGLARMIREEAGR